jgi:hypothetical protein
MGFPEAGLELVCGQKIEGQKWSPFRNYLRASHNGCSLMFVFPFNSTSNSYSTNEGYIEEDGLGKPTISEIVSLIHAALGNPEARFSKPILSQLGYGGFWGFTKGLIVYDEGVFIEDNPPGEVPMDKARLAERLEASDPSVRYVSCGYRSGEQSRSGVANNPCAVAVLGKEGARKFADISTNYDSDPRLFVFDDCCRDVWPKERCLALFAPGNEYIALGEDSQHSNLGRASIGVCREWKDSDLDKPGIVRYPEEALAELGY